MHRTPDALPAIEFELDASHPHVELNQLLKLAGLAASGGEGKALVAAGGVRVDGRPEARKTAKIHAGQTVTALGRTIHVHAPHA